MPLSIATFSNGVPADADTLSAIFHNPEPTTLGGTYASFDVVNGQLDKNDISGDLDYRTVRAGQSTNMKEVGATVNVDYFSDVTAGDDEWITVPGAAITYHCPYQALSSGPNTIIQPRVLITWTITAYFIGDANAEVDLRVIRVGPDDTPFIPSEQNRTIVSQTSGPSIPLKSTTSSTRTWSGHMFGTVAFGENQALLQVRLPSTASVQPTGHLRVYCRSMRAIVFR